MDENKRLTSTDEASAGPIVCANGCEDPDSAKQQHRKESSTDRRKNNRVATKLQRFESAPKARRFN
jgi:hypothetical protein